MTLKEPLTLLPELLPRVWGGQRLGPSAEPIGEAWVASERSVVATGPRAGWFLRDVCAAAGEELLGAGPVANGSRRFPLLIKLLDTSDWLSVQVHPDDEQAERLEGPGSSGKTEAWHILEAAPDAQLIAGLQPGTTRAALEADLAAGRLLSLLHCRPVMSGDTLLTPAGALHALGPGLFLYEVQQSSDITYRVWDWDRPQTAGRALHLEQGLAVTSVTARPTIVPRQWTDDSTQRLVACPFFVLDLVADGARFEDLGNAFHVVTAVAGRATLVGAGWSSCLGSFETVLVPAACGGYRVEGSTDFRALVAAPA